MAKTVHKLYLPVLMICLMACFSCQHRTAIQLHGIFTDHMVLQRDTLINIWGSAGANEPIRVEIQSQHAATIADSTGKWMVVMGPLKAGGPYELVISGASVLKLKDVLVGDVWLCTGESNMSFTMAQLNKQQAIAASAHDLIRLYTVPVNLSGQRREELDSAIWQTCVPDHVANFSATAYFFGKNLQKEAGVPIGLICAAVSGSIIEAWMGPEALLTVPAYSSGFGDRSPDKLDSSLSHRAAHAWQTSDTTDPNLFFSCRYNAMLYPFKNIAFKGIAWYQGESNVDQAYRYRKLFPAMIKHWRRVFGTPDLPFIFVQLAGFGATDSLPSESKMAELREAQAMALSLPHTAMAVTYEIGDAEQLQPANKEGVGYRLSRAALKMAYGRDVIYTGPVFKGMDVEGNKIRLFFDHVGSGLTTFDNTEQVSGFAISGLNQQYKLAQAFIDGPTVVVYNDQIAHPVTVRYAWADNPLAANLYNLEGLAAPPFRTDEWPGLTIEMRE